MSKHTFNQSIPQWFKNTSYSGKQYLPELVHFVIEHNKLTGYWSLNVCFHPDDANSLLAFSLNYKDCHRALKRLLRVYTTNR